MWELTEGKGDIYSKQSCFQSFPPLGFAHLCSQLPRQVLQPHWGGPGTPPAKTSPCPPSCSSQQKGSGDGFLLFLGLTCYYGVISHLRVLVFLAFVDLQQCCCLCFLVRGLFWAVVASSQAVEVMCSNSVLLWSGDRFAAARLVVLSHTQMFPFVIHPDQSRYWLQTSTEVDILFYVCT